jgi:hypothetical protein
LQYVIEGQHRLLADGEPVLFRNNVFDHAKPRLRADVHHRRAEHVGPPVERTVVG